MSTSKPKLQVTKDYSIFEMSIFNRDVGRTRSLTHSMKTHGYLPAYPIHCVRGEKGKLVIKAGHHRFHVASSLGIDVWYVVTDDTATIVELEQSTNPWKLKDYLTSQVRAGSDVYVAVQEYVDRTKISLSQAISMLGGECASSNNMTDKFKVGSFQIKESTHAEDVAYVVTQLAAVGVKFSNTQNFVSALSLLCMIPEFNADVFIHRAAANLSSFHKCATVSQYLDLIEKVYNHLARTKVNLAFLARESARKRSAVKHITTTN